MFDCLKRQHGLEIHPRVVTKLENRYYDKLDNILEYEEGLPLPLAFVEQQRRELSLVEKAIDLLNNRMAGAEWTAEDRQTVKEAIKLIRNAR